MHFLRYYVKWPGLWVILYSEVNSDSCVALTATAAVHVCNDLARLEIELQVDAVKGNDYSQNFSEFIRA